MMATDARLAELYERKIAKLREQKQLADTFNELLTKHGGLNEATHLTMKQTMRMLANSRRPGTIAYHPPPEEIRQIESSNKLGQLAKAIARQQTTVDQVDAEIRAISSPQSPSSSNPPNVQALKDWFAVYGKPERSAVVEGWLTEFSPSTKVYGSTKHHKGFKTQSKAMKKGRITR